MFFTGEFGGKPLSLETGMDLTGTTSLQVKIVPPGGATPIEHILDSSAITDAASGTVAYTIQPGDLAVAGRYAMQLTDQTPGRIVRSTITHFDVMPAL